MGEVAVMQHGMTPHLRLVCPELAQTHDHSLGLTPAAHDPVCLRYRGETPIAHVSLRHRTFDRAILYQDGNGSGAIILCTPADNVLAMDYTDARELQRQWRATLKHYAGVAGF